MKSSYDTRRLVDWLDKHELIPHSDSYIATITDYSNYADDYAHYIGKNGVASIDYLLGLPDEELNPLITAWVISGEGAEI